MTATESLSRALAGLLVLGVATLFGCASDEPTEENTGETADAVKAASTVKAPKPNAITFGRATKEVRDSVPIAKKRGAEPKVLVSVKLDDVTTAERLLLRGELTLSTCGAKDISGDASDGEKNPCSIPELEGSPYDYSPHFAALIALGKSPGDTNGPKLSDVHDTSCSLREHHCTVTIPQVSTQSARAAQAAYVNLVVSADDPNARGFDLGS